jgi:hypothetical protein
MLTIIPSALSLRSETFLVAPEKPFGASNGAG